MPEFTTSCRLLMGIPEGRKPLGSPSHIGEDNIKMVIIGIGLRDMDWMHPVQVA